MSSFKNILWKIPVVIGALVVGCMAASQVGWSGAESIVERGQAGVVTDLLLIGTLALSYGTVVLVQRIAKPMLWVMIPILLYFAIVPGAWNGFASDFDGGREASFCERLHFGAHER
jgi:hypothetical protein